MPALVRGTPGTTVDLNWFTAIAGVKNDVFQIEYRIRDITGGLPGTQIFPVAGFQDATVAPARFGVGSYYAYNPLTSLGWGPSPDANIGTHRIDWQWKAESDSVIQGGSEDFEVLSEEAAPPPSTYYITVQDIRDEGITETMAGDSTVLTKIMIAQAFIDRACRQWFEPRALTISFDGTDSDTIHLGVPIISVDYVRLNNSETDLEDHLFKVYSARSYPDDRRNPRIKLVRSDDVHNIFARPIMHGSHLKFRKGRQNQEVKGTFGFIEEDGSTPALIQRAMTKYTINLLQNPLFHDQSTGSPSVPPPPPIVGPLLEEETDDHRQKYGQAGGSVAPRRPGLTGITDDQEILDIIKLYRAPIGLATPAHWSHT